MIYVGVQLELQKGYNVKPGEQKKTGYNYVTEKSLPIRVP